MEAKIVHKIDMVRLANLILNNYAIRLEDGILQLYLIKETKFIIEFIEDFINEDLPAQYIFIEEDINQIAEDVEIFVLRELSNRLHTHIYRLDKEDKTTLLKSHKEYFIYNEDSL